MNENIPRILLVSTRVTVGSVPLEIGFRAVTPKIIAGGPVEIEAFVINNSESPLKLFISADRLRLRPAQYSFEAYFEDILIDDPMSDVPFMGGPECNAIVSAENPWRQLILLNEYVSLENLLHLMLNGTTGVMNLSCNYSLKYASTANDNLYQNEKVIQLKLSLKIHRDDEQLKKLSKKLYNDCLQKPLNTHSLSLLLSLRSAATDLIKKLIKHPNTEVANQALLAYNSFF
jgi:hypothetical protein